MEEGPTPFPTWPGAHRRRFISRAVAALALSAACAGCSQRMDHQPHLEPLEESTFFDNGMASRPAVPGTVARGQLQLDEHFYEGLVDGQPARTYPQKLLDEWRPEELLARGQERFDIFCATCHDRVGNGQGMVVQRGFPHPPSYHIDRLRAAPVGHFFDVATNGFGRMPSYAHQISAADRWAIVAYIRTLQFSQHAPLAELPDDARQRLEEIKP